MPSHIAIASVCAEWMAVGVTLIGLSSLILQLTNFQNLVDPFRGYRGSDWLGPWASQKRSKALVPLRGESPKGPEIQGNYATGLCGLNNVHVSRKPVVNLKAKASWTAIFAIFHPNALPIGRQSLTASGSPPKADQVALEGVLVAVTPEQSWKQRLETRELTKHRDKLYKYSDAAGLRTAYSGYSGIWEVHWPLGAVAEVEFFPLDSHDEGQENYPLSFPRQADNCILMLVGIIECKALGKLAFPEPRDQGASVLELLKRGFMAHGKTSHLFNMMGGNSYEVDYLYRRALEEDEEQVLANNLKLMIPTLELDLNRSPVKPWDKSQKYSVVFIPLAEEQFLATALDCLPWSSLGWSMHRGMQCLLVAYGERVMKAYRRMFAHTLKVTIETHASVLKSQGWSSSIVHDCMPDNSATSVMAGGGDSGDSVRIVTAAARLQTKRPDEALNETQFWRSLVGQKAPFKAPETQPLGEDTIIALTKLFVLAWSVELDHRLYEDLPHTMLVA